MTIEEMIKQSECFGVAFDAHTPECRTCDVKLKCDAKCRMHAAIKPTPTIVADVEDITSAKTENKVKPQEKTKKEVKEIVSKSYSSDMPEWKKFTLEQLETIAVERGLNLADFDKFKVNNIRRMRLTMALKKTYEV